MKKLEIGDLPPELTTSPSACVTLAGLDVANNPIHRTIWESFTTNRQERVPLFLKLIPPNHVFPVTKPKKTSYDPYTPKGILKTKWLSKHLYEVPAVAVQFVDLDWDSPAWNEKRSECVSKLEILRGSLNGRSTRVGLVLIQKRAALPGADDQIAAERAASLCSACDLSGKTLFVLPHSDHLYGYTLRLQNAFYELAQTYYHHESKRVKNLKDALSKTVTQQTVKIQALAVRHQFKMAFYSELKQDVRAALTHYKGGYASLTEVKNSNTNQLEIRTIAGFINYKMCYLSFSNGQARDAINQFKSHIDIYKSRIGEPELAFEHNAWMSKQFSHFGDLFEEAVQQGLAPRQDEHPGFYYQQAANQASYRKSQCHKLCKNFDEKPDFEILEGYDSLEYYGQRPWRACSISLEPPDPEKEIKGILALKYKELYEVDHSMLIIPLLSSAITQFKKYKCPRMKRQLTVEMGEEYYYYKDYKQTLILLKHVLWDYRLEKWRAIVSSILTTALRAAFLSANVHDYISLGIEMISNWIISSSDEKITVQNNINNILMKKPLIAMPGIPEQDCKDAEKLWLERTSSPIDPPIFTIQMASIVPFIECKAGFGSVTYMADQKITVTVYLRMNCPQPMSFSKLSVFFNNEYYNEFCEVPCSSEKTTVPDDKNMRKLYLIPRNTHTYTFTFIPSQSDIGKTIQITSVALQMGFPEHICAVLHWSTPPEVYPVEVSYPISAKAGSFSDDPTFQNIIPQPHASILPRNARITLSINHQPPVLINEFYKFDISIKNDEIVKIENVSLTVSLKEGQEQFVHENTHLSDSMEQPKQFVQYLSNLTLEEIAPGEKIQKCIYMKALEVSVRKLVFDVTYNINIDVDDQQLCCCCRKTQDLEIITVEPFEFVVRILNKKFEELKAIRAEEPFILKIDVHSYSSLPLSLEDSFIDLPHHISFVDKKIPSMLKKLDLNFNEAGTDCLLLVAAADCPAKIILGNYTLKWKRKSTDDTYPIVLSEIILPSADVTKPPIFVEMKIPATGLARKPLPVTYSIHNRTTIVQDMELSMENSDSFMFAGNKQMHFRILPRDVYVLSYILYPLLPGFAVLPHIKLVLNPGRGGSELSLDSLVKDMTPSHVFIMPQGKVRSTEDLTESMSGVLLK